MIETCGTPELWHAAVFHSAESAGNPTGVVLGGAGLDTASRQAWATLLGFPDTVFLDPEIEGWRAETFSPTQPISFCIQTLLAARAVLRLRCPEEQDPASFSLGARRLEVGALSGGAEGVEWLRIARGEVRVLREDALPTGLRPPGAAVRGPVVDAGRRRLYLEFPHFAALESVSLSAPAVLDYCRQADLHGVCLYARSGTAEVSLRVFTTSLDGHEDAATGGAVAGLSRLLHAGEVGAGGEWTVRQGQGPPHRRGTLFLRLTPQQGALGVGGRVRVLAAGRLLAEGM